MFDISWIAIFKIMGAGAFTFVILPLLLVFRDMLLHKAIGKWVLTDDLNSLIRMCESDRWFLDNKYNKKFGVAFGTNGASFNIDGKTVSYEKYIEYEEGRDFHMNRFKFADSKIVMRHNLITWLTRHYKQAEGANPIPYLREKLYESAGAHENGKA